MECVIAAMKQDNAELVNEATDLLYHLLVLLAERNVEFNEVLAEIQRRRGISTCQ